MLFIIFILLHRAVCLLYFFAIVSAMLYFICMLIPKKRVHRKMCKEMQYMDMLDASSSVHVHWHGARSVWAIHCNHMYTFFLIFCFKGQQPLTVRYWYDIINFKERCARDSLRVIYAWDIVLFNNFNLSISTL